MKPIEPVLCIFLIFLIPFLSCKVVYGQCQKDQKSLLLNLKANLTASSKSSRLVSWDVSTDCCLWKGVTCDKTGHVIKLALDNQTLSGEISNSSSLFDLQYLEGLNLAYNNFYSPIPSGLYKLRNLTYLNLSNALFFGEISADLGLMARLVTLDLSTQFPEFDRLEVRNLNLEVVFQKLTMLEELYLDGVNISATGNDWCNAFSSLSKLRVLSLSTCYLSGPMETSLLQLSSLSVLNLNNNNLSAPVPDFFADFTNLTSLSLTSCNLQGHFPQRILQVPTLQNVDLSNNYLITGTIPELPKNGSLRSIVLSYTKFSNSLPDSIGTVGNLSKIDLSNCNFHGPIPSTMANLKELVYVDFSANKFNGSIPSFQMSKKLKYIDLSRNYLSGRISSTHFQGLADLYFVNLGLNSLGGSIPPSLFTLQSLQKLQLSNNRFGGQIADFPNASTSWLDTLDLSDNQLKGPIAKSFFELGRLNVLSLSSNHFNGTFPLQMINRLPNLTRLELSHNLLSVEVNSSNSNLPKLSVLGLSSCNLQTFPNLKNQTKMNILDLSENKIAGEIPTWIWEIGDENFQQLNLSHNLLSSLQSNYTIKNLLVLDLNSNQLQGGFPIPPFTAVYVDYSNNNINYSIPPYIGNFFAFALFVSFSNNKLTGDIPESICKAPYLQVLDLFNNSLTGSIPSCLFDSMESLKVLHLGSNNIEGTIPDNILASCALKTLDLSDNHLTGRVPRSISNCTSLEVLNIGRNNIEDTFPCMLKGTSSLRVLILRSNIFHGNLSCFPENNSWQNLQIIDVAMNKFSGTLSSISISYWTGMILGGNRSRAQDLSTDVLSLTNVYYRDALTVTFKGLDLELVKILTVFTSIDISNNNFEGNIPDTIGELSALFGLNVSYNNLNGTIPKSIGNLTRLESLDLSHNQLTGMIPTELTYLNFLSFLNLSFNQLSGRIPLAQQFWTFLESSFQGNIGLCGFPLNVSCIESAPAQAPASHGEYSVSNTKSDWQFIFTGIGFGIGVAIILAPLIVCNEVQEWYDEQLYKIFLLIFPRYKYCYIRYDEGKVEPATSNFEDDFLDDTEDSDADEFKWEDEASFGGGKYCVFCSKLDLYRRKVVHDPKCTCHSASSPLYFTSPRSSSSLLVLYH